jgi:hypothetical protein
LKHVSIKIQKEFENLLIKSSSSSDSISDSIVNCFHSFSNKTIECTNSYDAVCFIGIPPDQTFSEVVAGCTRVIFFYQFNLSFHLNNLLKDAEYLFASVSYYVINPTSHINNEKLLCSIHCNRDNCNTNEIYNKVIEMAQKYISGPRY